MKISSLPKRGIYEVNFSYHSKMGGYFVFNLWRMSNHVEKKKS
jgi:hypothetical protein